MKYAKMALGPSLSFITGGMLICYLVPTLSLITDFLTEMSMNKFFHTSKLKKKDVKIRLSKILQQKTSSCTLLKKYTI